MTWWSLRRRHAVTPAAEREYRPVTAVPPSGRPQAAAPPSGRQASGPQHGNWLGPDRSRPGPPGPAQAGTGPYGAGEPGDIPGHGLGRPGSAWSGTRRHGAAAPSAVQHAGNQAGNGAGALGPAQPSSPAAPVAVLVPAAAPGDPGQGDQAAQRAGGPWPDICDQFGLHLLVLAEQLRACLDELEADEDDPERLKRLYQVDHAVTRMRRASRDLRTLAGRSEQEIAGFTTSLLDIIRMAASAIERYPQVAIGRVAGLAVLGYAADDVGSVMAALLDNATRYSPGTVTVSCHLLEDGGAMFRIEDSGIGVGAEQVAALNAAFAGPVREVDERTGRHTGFPVVHRIARRHSLGVRLAARPLPGSGTVAMVTLPSHLLCEAPAEEGQRRPAPADSAAPQRPPQPSPAAALPHGEPTRAHPLPSWTPPEPPSRDTGKGPERDTSNLPRRERASLRGGEPRPRKKRERGMVPTAEQQAAARRAFADDLSAFSLGAGGLAGPADPLAAAQGEDAATTATEEGAQP